MTNLLPFPLLCALLLTFYVSSAQTTINSLLEQPVSDLPVYDTTACKDCIFIQVLYGDAAFLNLDVLQRFVVEDITRVDMVFSSFSRNPNFNQTTLNRERLNNLQKVAPKLFDSTSIHWTMLRQTSCHSLEESERLFHGFVVHISPGKAMRDREGKLAPATVVKPTKKTTARPRLVTRDTIIREAEVSMRENTKRECDFTGKYIPKDKKKAAQGVRYDKPGRGRIPEKKCQTVSLGYDYDTAYYDRKYKINAATGELIDRSLKIDRVSDTTVIDAMGRNWNDWKSEKVVIVQDVTGSMSGYLTQILTWHELYANRGVEHYVFFNDGDNKADRDKIAGKTGGCHYVQSKRLSEIQDAAQMAARSGSGGDTQENNVEALIYAQKKYPECTILVMIADNYAPVRDYKLISEVNKPVHVVVCGGNGEVVHSDYLSIAAVTGGSVHTSTMDLNLKDKATEGQILVINERKYLFNNGRFQLQVD